MVTMSGMADADDDFDAMFHRTLARATAVARRIVGDPALAEDLAAEAFARAYARWPRLRRSAHVEGWVFRVVTNLAIDHLRRRPPDVRAAGTADDIDTLTLRLALADAMSRLPAASARSSPSATSRTCPRSTSPAPSA